MKHTVISSGIFYKGVTEDLRSPMQSGSTCVYTPGTTVIANGIDLDPTEDCGKGINFCRTLAEALKWGKTVVKVKVPEKVSIVDTGNKLRAERVEVISKANLSGAYLSGANLYGANLYGAYLAGAYLAGAYGTPISGVPNGWKINASGLFVKNN